MYFYGALQTLFSAKSSCVVIIVLIDEFIMKLFYTSSSNEKNWNEIYGHVTFEKCGWMEDLNLYPLD